MLQHIVPQHYLKGFCDPVPSKRQGRVVWEFRFKDDVVCRRAPKNVGRIADYYSVETADGLHNPAIEGVLSQIESRTAPIIARLRDEHLALADEDRWWLAMFIAFQMVRGPAFRDHVEKALGLIGTVMLRAMARREEYFARVLRETPGIAEEDRTPAKIEEFRRMAAEPEKHFEISGTPEGSLRMMRLAPRFVPHIATLRWEFLVAGGGESFVTSDTPVTLRNPRLRPGFGAGLRLPGTELSLPIGPRVCLRAIRDNATERGHPVTVNDDIVRDLNRERTRQAQLFIAGDNRTSVEWTKRRYKELLDRGEAHARPFEAYIIEGTGPTTNVVHRVRVEPRCEADEEKRAPG